MIILVSKYDHCLVDLLYRHKSGELACDIPLIISNHPDNQAIADFYKIPYAIVPVTKDNKAQPKRKIQALIDEHEAGLHGAGALHADSVERVCATGIRSALSTFTTRSCRLLLGRVPTIRRSSAG